MWAPADAHYLRTWSRGFRLSERRVPTANEHGGGHRAWRQVDFSPMSRKIVVFLFSVIGGGAIGFVCGVEHPVFLVTLAVLWGVLNSVI